MTDVLDTAITDKAVYRGPSAQAWFADGERVGYDPKARAIVATQDAPLKTFLRREGEVPHAVTFLPGYPDGSFGWAKVRPHLPNAAQMPKLFVEYVGMGDSDKPKDYAYSTAERTDLVEALWRDLSVQSTTLVAFDFSSLVVLEHLRRRRVGIRDFTFEACSGFTHVTARPVAQPPKAAFVTRLRSGQLPSQTARQLPDLS